MLLYEAAPTLTSHYLLLTSFHKGINEMKWDFHGVTWLHIERWMILTYSATIVGPPRSTGVRGHYITRYYHLSNHTVLTCKRAVTTVRWRKWHQIEVRGRTPTALYWRRTSGGHSLPHWTCGARWNCGAVTSKRKNKTANHATSGLSQSSHDLMHLKPSGTAITCILLFVKNIKTNPHG